MRSEAKSLPASRQGASSGDKKIEEDRINEMVKAIMKVARGDYSTQVKPSGKNDDLDSLAVGINMMVDDIEHTLSERKKAEKKIQESEEKFRNIFNYAKDGLILVDNKMKIVNANETALDILNYRKKESILGKSILDLHTREDHNKCKSNILSTLEGKSTTYDCPYKTSKNTLIPAETSLSPIVIDRETYVLIIFRDITERKKAEEELKTERKKLETYIETMADGFSTNDKNGIIIQANKACLEMYGCKSPEEMIGKPIFKFIAKRELPQITKRFMQAVKNKEGSIKNLEIIARRKDGSEFPILLSTTFIWDEKGNLLDNVTIIKDITERKKAEEDILAGKKKLENTMESMVDSATLLDLNGKFTNVNQAWINLTGYKLNEIIGELPTKFLAKREWAKNLAAIKESFRTGELRNFETIVLTKEGKEVPIQLNAKVMKDSQGKPTGQIVSIRDITERKELEEQRLESNRRLQQVAQELTIAHDDLKVAIETKGEFMNIATHELKTPLQPIIGYTDRLLQSSKPTDWQKERLAIILENAKHLEKLIQDVLDVNKMETGIMKFSMKECDLLELIKEVYESFEPVVAKKGLEFILDIPKTAGKIKVREDADRLTQVFSNLIDNATKFTDKGAITLQLKDEKDTAIVSVKDTGIGIGKKDIPKLFTKFFQTDISDGRKQGGTGLGLAICKEIVKAHNGEISAQSTLGKGSTFRVILPKITNSSKGKGVKR